MIMIDLHAYIYNNQNAIICWGADKWPIDQQDHDLPVRTIMEYFPIPLEDFLLMIQVEISQHCFLF